MYTDLFHLEGGIDQLQDIYSDYSIYYDPDLSGNSYLNGQIHALNGGGALTPVPEVIPGDANYDGFINETDAAILAANWQTLTGATWDMGDFNGDYAVNDIDATILAANWQSVASDAVPEPGALTLLAISGLMLLGLGARRRKR